MGWKWITPGGGTAAYSRGSSRSIPKPSYKDSRRRALKLLFEAWYEREMADRSWIKDLKDPKYRCPPSIARTVCVPATKVFMGFSGELQIPAHTVTFYDNYPEKWTRYDVSSLWKSEATKAMLGYDMAHHPGGVYELRQRTPEGYGQQCVYDKCGKLITSGPGAGSADKVSPEVKTPVMVYVPMFGPVVVGLPLRHFYADVQPFAWALELDGDRSNPNANGKYYQMYAKARPTINPPEAIPVSGAIAPEASASIIQGLSR